MVFIKVSIFTTSKRIQREKLINSRMILFGMPALYEDWGIGPEDPDKHKVGHTIFDLLTSNREFMLYGARILRKNSPEWEEYMEKEKRIFKRFDEEVLQRRISGLRGREALTIDSPFRAMHYSGKRLAYDTDIALICEIAVAKRQIDVFRNTEFGNVLVDLSAKARILGKLYYDGTLHDALSEFAEKGYTFNLWNMVWHRDNLKDGIKGGNASLITPIERATLDDVFEFARKT